MLNAKALTELLSNNSDERLCKRWSIMTPNGTLLAYSQPTDIRELRKQAAIAALSWQEHQEPSRRDSTDPEGESGEITMPGLLRTLTMESESANVIIRKIQPQLLLVLEGGIPPRRRRFEAHVTPENLSDPPYPSQNGSTSETVPGSSASSVAESSRGGASTGVLLLQRRKLDALASAIAQDLEKTGFKMPGDGSTKLF